MKTGNIGIRNLVDIGVGDIDVYGTDLRKKNNLFAATEKVKIRIGVFFDGTGNNKFNSDAKYYKQKLPLDVKSIPEKEKFKNIVIESGSSYWNSYSNIALLHDLYEEKIERSSDNNPELQILQLKFYIQGIGTKQDDEDDNLGSALGEGSRGVIDRVDEACAAISAGIKIALDNFGSDKKLEIESIQFDVFGFSRGAAAARHFCNEILKTGREEINDRFGKINAGEISRKINQKKEKVEGISAEIGDYKADGQKKVIDNNIEQPRPVLLTGKIFTGGTLGELLKDEGIAFPKYHVSVEFLGLFDTVISQMLESKKIIDRSRDPITNSFITSLLPIFLKWIPTFVSLIMKVNPNIKNPNIKKILHFKAQDEWRENFPFTDIGYFDNENTLVKEVAVLGAHSDIGGGYWHTEKEFNTLQFFDLNVDADPLEKLIMEEQKVKLRDWYISEKYCKPNQILWKTMHHVSKTSNPYSLSSFAGYELIEEDILGTATSKVVNNVLYTLVGYHYKLQSVRALSNKLSLAYMNVMKDIAVNFAGTPFNISVSKTQHPEEYQYNKDNVKIMQQYEELIKKAAEDGWTNKEGKKITHTNFFDDKNKFPIPVQIYYFIKEKMVHLSANFNAPFSPLVKELDHEDFVYTNIPRYTDRDEFKNPPYKRYNYTPDLTPYDLQ